MNWPHFLLSVAGIYFLYYLVNILIDAAAVKRTAAANLTTNELSFSETVEPKVLQHEPVTAKAHLEPEIIASGGVSISEACILARRRLVHFTGAVSF